jgi:hypothetical protein
MMVIITRKKHMTKIMARITIVYTNNGINLMISHHMIKGIHMIPGIDESLYATHKILMTNAPVNIIMNSSGLLKIAIADTTRPITGTHLIANKNALSLSNTSLRCLKIF